MPWSARWARAKPFGPVPARSLGCKALDPGWARSVPWAPLGLLLLSGCPAPTSSEGDDDDDTAEPTPAPVADWDAVFALISFRCGCHDDVQRAGGMWDLTDDASAWDALVDRPSDDVPTMARVEPGDPENSYVIAKVEGRQRDVDGAGSRMPPTGFPLREAQITLLRDWIQAGAER